MTPDLARSPIRQKLSLCSLHQGRTYRNLQKALLLLKSTLKAVKQVLKLNLLESISTKVKTGNAIFKMPVTRLLRSLMQDSEFVDIVSHFKFPSKLIYNNLFEPHLDHDKYIVYET